MTIDAHTHLFAPDRVRYPIHTHASMGPFADGSIPRLMSQKAAAGVDRVVAISPWPYRWDNQYVLDTLPDNREWLAVVALVNPQHPEAPQQLTRYVREHGVSGVRIQGRIHNLPPLDDPAATPLWAQAVQLGVPVDVNATLDEYAQVERRALQFPEARIILDHCGYVNRAFAPQLANLAPVLRLAGHPNVYAKLTFLPLASKQPYPFTDVHWMVRAVVDSFGPQRCIFGSNFPTEQYTPNVSYAQAVHLFSVVIDFKTEERKWILGGTAATLWQWGKAQTFASSAVTRGCHGQAQG